MRLGRIVRPGFRESFDELTDGLIETCLSLLLASFLQFVERGKILFVLAAQTVFLNAEIVELALVGRFWLR